MLVAKEVAGAPQDGTARAQLPQEDVGAGAENVGVAKLVVVYTSGAGVEYA
jgi:hypothetical protein